MNKPPDNLLEPTLSADGAIKPIFSTRAGFLLAFFGGGSAITFFSALNSERLGRLGRDLPAYLAGIGLIAGLVYLQVEHPRLLETAEENGETTSYAVVAHRALGLLLWGGYYWLHNKHYRAMAVTGTRHPSPWIAAIGCYVAGFGLVNIALRLMAGEQ